MTYLNCGLFTPQRQSTLFSRNALDNYAMGYKPTPMPRR
jgi:hypothetical protein